MSVKCIYQGVVVDKLGTLNERKTKKYASYYDAHVAAEKLCKRVLGDRGNTMIREMDVSGVLVKSTCPDFMASSDDVVSLEQLNLFGLDLAQVKRDLAGMSVGDAIEFGADYVIRVSFIGCTPGWPMYGRRMYEYTDYVDFYGVAYGDDAMVQVLREIY